MYEFWGGFPQRTVCDNLKTGVLRHPREGCFSRIKLNTNVQKVLGKHVRSAVSFYTCMLRRELNLLIRLLAKGTP